MPRGKRAEKAVTSVTITNPGPFGTPTVTATVEDRGPIQPNFENESDEELIKRHIALDDWIKAENKRFASHLEPHKQMLEVIANEFLRRFTERKSENSKTEYGTAYISTLLNIAVSPEGGVYDVVATGPNGEQTWEKRTGREALLDFALDHWDEIGNELLMISAQKDSVRRWMDEHNGVPPPGIKHSWFKRVNIRRG